MSTKELQIAERARKYKHEALTNLQQFIDMSSLEICFLDLNRKSSPGVDGKTWQEYAKEKPARLPELLTLMKSGKYQAPSIRRVYIPKGKTGRRYEGIAEAVWEI
jgi:RNA-directed DNA polymerase